MSSTKQRRIAAAVAAVALCAGLSTPVTASADPEAPPGPDPTPPAVDAPQAQLPDLGPGPYNVIYRARVDGASRGATVNYAIADDEVNTANPTMVPGRVFESTGVVSDPQKAGMQVSIRWPYSASLHCEILVNDQFIAQADQFVAPRLIPARDDPGYGVLSCGSVTNFPTGNTEPVDALPPPPVEPAPAPAPVA